MMVYRTSESLSHSTVCWCTLVICLLSLFYLFLCDQIFKQLPLSKDIRLSPTSACFTKHSSQVPFTLPQITRCHPSFGARERTQQLRTLAVLICDLGPVPSTCMAKHTYYSSFKGSNTLLCPLWVPVHLWCTHIHANIYTHKKTFKKILSFFLVWINK